MQKIHLLSKEENKFLSSSNTVTNDTNEEKSEMMIKITKSLYQMNILEQNMNKIYQKGDKHMPNTFNACKYLMFEALNKLSPEEVVPIVSYSKKGSEFDYQSADAIRVSKMLNGLGCKITPLQFAQKLLQVIPETEFIEKIEISGNGFINLKLKQEYIENVIDDIVIKGVLPPCVPRRKVIVDFSSPNIAKEMHVGHLRSTVIGDAICRIFEFVRFDVVRVNHIGDWGTQFGMLIAHLEDSFSDGKYVETDITDLQQFYKQSKERFDKEEDFKKRAYKKVVELQNGSDANVMTSWRKICDVSRNEFQQIYNKLGIVLTEKGESFYQSRMKQLIADLNKEGKLINEDGCQIMRIPGFEVPLIVVKSDGGFTYDTSDLATIKYRLEEEQGDWLIYVVDLGQKQHLEQIYAAARLLKWYDSTTHRVEHIGFGVVRGEGNKKFKSRSGDTIKLSELLKESVIRAHAKLIERGFDSKYSKEELTQIAEALGYSCIKYADLSHHLVADYVFSFDRMLDDRGNTAVYLIYTYSRVRSIIRKSGISESDIIAYVQKNGIKIGNEHELKLMKKLVHFPEVVYRIVFESYPHFICEYLFELSVTLTEFYDACQIINKNEKSVDMNRLSQVYASSLVMKKGAELLGLMLLERM